MKNLLAGRQISLCILLFVASGSLGAAAELQDCKGGCANAVVREIPPAARRPYSKENLTAFSYTQPMIPPIEYDHPYPGKWTVTRVNEQEMKLACPTAMGGHIILACAHLDPCNIYMLNDAILKAVGWNYEIVLRHEFAHCNGWPWNHPGIERPTL